MSQTRMTKQRAIILEELRKVKSHPTADEVYTMVRKSLPRISLGTVYRNLDFLVETGKVIKIEAAGSTKRFDGDTSWHQHVRCIHCGRVGDVLPSSPQHIDIHGVDVADFTITGARVEYDGVCAQCSNT